MEKEKFEKLLQIFEKSTRDARILILNQGILMFEKTHIEFMLRENYIRNC